MKAFFSSDLLPYPPQDFLLTYLHGFCDYNFMIFFFCDVMWFSCLLLIVMYFDLFSVCVFFILIFCIFHFALGFPPGDGFQLGPL